MPSEADETTSLLSGRGIWWNGGIDTEAGNLERQATLLKALGITRVHVQVTEDLKRPYDCKATYPLRGGVTPKKVGELAKALTKQGIFTVALLYVAPSTAYIDSLVDGQSPLIKELVDNGIRVIEYDLEGGWIDALGRCDYKKDPKVAYKRLFSATRKLTSGAPVGITTHEGRVAQVRLDVADWLAIQAYSTCKDNTCKAFDDNTEGPGFKQTRIVGLGTVQTFQGPVVVGLAAYSQKWPNHTEEEAMTRAFDAFLSIQAKNPAKFVGHMFWSTRPVFGNSAIANFLKSTKGKSAVYTSRPDALCRFNQASLAFEGTPVEQAQCLMRKVKKGGVVDRDPAELPPVLASRLPKPVGITKSQLRQLLAEKNLNELQVGGSLDSPISHAHGGRKDAPMAKWRNILSYTILVTTFAR